MKYRQPMFAMYEEPLNGQQRGYRQPGEKLRPRDSFVAMECEHGKCSVRALRKNWAAELAHMSVPSPEPHEEKAQREYSRLGARGRKVVEAAYKTDRMFVPRARQQERALRALLDADRIEACIAADDLMLRNAR